MKSFWIDQIQAKTTRMENKLDAYAPTVLPLCDMIKRNKLDVRNIDSELK